MAMVLLIMVVSVVLVVFELFTLGLGKASYDGNCVGDDCGVCGACVGEVVYEVGWTGEVTVAIGLVITAMSAGPE